MSYFHTVHQHIICSGLCVFSFFCHLWSDSNRAPFAFFSLSLTAVCEESDYVRSLPPLCRPASLARGSDSACEPSSLEVSSVGQREGREEQRGKGREAGKDGSEGNGDWHRRGQIAGFAVAVCQLVIKADPSVKLSSVISLCHLLCMLCIVSGFLPTFWCITPISVTWVG